MDVLVLVRCDTVLRVKKRLFCLKMTGLDTLSGDFQVRCFIETRKAMFGMVK